MDDIRINGRQRAVFEVGEGEVVVSIREGELRIEGDGPLTVSPEASNVVKIERRGAREWNLDNFMAVVRKWDEDKDG